MYPTFQDTNNNIVTIEQLNDDINWKNKQTILQINTLNVVFENRTLHSLLILPHFCLVYDCKEPWMWTSVNVLIAFSCIYVSLFMIIKSRLHQWAHGELSLSLYIYIFSSDPECNLWVTKWSQTSELNVEHWNGSQ